MTESEREKYLFDLDETLLQGSIMFSPWCHLLILESDKAFVSGAFLASLLTSLAGIEAQLRFDHSVPGADLRLAKLIDSSDIPAELKTELHELRKFRNQWIHVPDPWEEESLRQKMEDPETAGDDFEPWAIRAVTALRQLFYWFQGT